MAWLALSPCSTLQTDREGRVEESRNLATAFWTILYILGVFLAESLHEQRREPRAGAAAERAEDEEALQPLAVGRHPPQPLQRGLDQLLSVSLRFVKLL